jgi:hypothetical protein
MKQKPKTEMILLVNFHPTESFLTWVDFFKLAKSLDPPLHGIQEIFCS